MQTFSTISLLDHAEAHFHTVGCMVNPDDDNGDDYDCDDYYGHDGANVDGFYDSGVQNLQF